jgi:23S rRNA pseudouridine1911/1915/1917 synthase
MANLPPEAFGHSTAPFADEGLAADRGAGGALADDDDEEDGLDLGAAASGEGDAAGELAAEGGSYRRVGPPVKPEAAGARVDRYLGKRFPFLTRSGWQRRIEGGTVVVNGARVKPAHRLKVGDAVLLFSPHAEEPEVDRGIRVLWQAGAVMAVYKPGNLPMHENGPYRENTFTRLVWRELGREWCAVHRLDRETSGIVLCGATAEARATLALGLRDRRTRKEYLCVVRGAPAASDWLVDAPIGKPVGSAIRIKKWVVPSGLPAQTRFERLASAPRGALVRAHPLTGRTNQIRIHAAYGGTPLFGDKTYHENEAVFLDYWENGMTPFVREHVGAERCALHAAALTFVHPESRREVRVECELPEDMAALWATLSAER